MPLQYDEDEARDIHSIILKQAIAKNEVLAKHGVAVQGMVQRLQAFNDPEKDILGDEGRQLLAQAGLVWQNIIINEKFDID